MDLYFNNEKEFSNMWYVFSYGALYAYRHRLVDFDMLDFYLFQMSAMDIFERLGVERSLIDYIGGAIQIEDVEVWYVDEIPGSILNRYINQLTLEIDEHILEEILENRRFEFMPHINKADGVSLKLVFFNEYSVSIYFNILFLGILRLLRKCWFYDCLKQNLSVLKNTLHYLYNYQDYYRNELLLDVYKMFAERGIDYELLLVKAELAAVRCIRSYFNTSQDNLVKNINLIQSEGLAYRVMKV